MSNLLACLIHKSYSKHLSQTKQPDSGLNSSLSQYLLRNSSKLYRSCCFGFVHHGGGLRGGVFAPHKLMMWHFYKKRKIICKISLSNVNLLSAYIKTPGNHNPFSYFLNGVSENRPSTRFHGRQPCGCLYLSRCCSASDTDQKRSTATGTDQMSVVWITHWSISGISAGSVALRTKTSVNWTSLVSHVDLELDCIIGYLRQRTTPLQLHRVWLRNQLICSVNVLHFCFKFVSFVKVVHIYRTWRSQVNRSWSFSRVLFRAELIVELHQWSISRVDYKKASRRHRSLSAFIGLVQ